MTLNANDIQEIETMFARPGVDASVFGTFRSRFPEASLTKCDATDVADADPYKELGRFTLYLVDGRDHCWQLTDDPEAATGIVVVENKTS